MTDKPHPPVRAIPPGSGAVLRSGLHRSIIIFGIALTALLALYLYAAVAMDPADATVVTLTIGGVATPCAGVLILFGYVKARASVVGDTLVIPGLQLAIRMGTAALVIGFSGAAAAVVLGFVFALSGLDFAVVTSLLAGVIVILPTSIADTLRRTCLRLVG